MKTYRGKRTSSGCVVEVNGYELPPRSDLFRNFERAASFDWGFGGSGAGQLALAIIADCYGDDEVALFAYQTFKWRCVSHLPREGFELTEAQVREFVEAIREEASRKRERAERNQRVASASIPGRPRSA